ncbi:MAG TPA: glycosyltransferase family 4 protein, partial [Dongiaceae bacterium]|nr:glycosyltransferase family 4 protein [Dongiaceae bacterium]
MKLCFVVESGTDVRLVDGLAERADVTVLARRIRGGVEISREPENAARILVGAASRARFAAGVLTALLTQRPRFDQVLVQGYGAAALAANLAGRLSGMPVAMLVCSPVEHYYRCRREHPEPDRPFRARELRGLVALARLNARVGSSYVVLSEYLAGVVRAHGARQPVHIVPVYGVDTDRFTPATEPRSELRRRLGLGLGGALLFFSSRVTPEKDADTLLDAVARLRAEGRDVRLLHRSGGYRAFAQLATARGLGDAVVATDAVHPERELPLSYQASDLCVQASRAEGLGFSPLEALACEVPVVATAVGGLR